MAFVEPTPATFKVNYPEFAGVADAVVQNAINKAGLQVDQTWGEDAYTIAKELYAAHVLAVAGLGTSAASQVAGYGPGVVELHAGRHKIKFAEGATVGGNSSTARLFATPYGAEFYQLRRKLFGGPRVIRGGVNEPFPIWSDVPPQ